MKVSRPVDHHVVHLVGAVNDTVFSLLGAMTHVQAEMGVDQTVILVDEPAQRYLLPRFHPSIRLVLISAHLGPLRRMRRSLQCLREVVNSQPTRALHLHGFIPSLVGTYAARFHGLSQTLYFSPHGSRLLKPIVAVSALTRLAFKSVARLSDQRTIANSAFDASALVRVTNEKIQIVESPVDSVFFAAARHEVRRPLLMTVSRNRNYEAAAMFAQLAVLLSEESLQVSCNWLGTADADSLARLSAANVAVFDITDAAERASRLSSAWVYVAFVGELGFPLFLAEAMAAGLPCVVWDTPYHRDVIEDGKSGFCCSSYPQLLACVTRLIDSPEERQRIGSAARSEAHRRFDSKTFRDAFLAAYHPAPSKVEVAGKPGRPLRKPSL
ncbi:MAG: glycosyltransferase family 4 protein [Pseudomonadota bacterium]|nr:glycosyltransferase family 4 protein [Pseudomonadota bacterium]